MKNFITNYEIKLIFGIDCNWISRSRHPQHGETRNRQRGGPEHEFIVLESNTWRNMK